MSFTLAVGASAVAAVPERALAAQPEIQQTGPVTTLVVPGQAAQAGGGLDYGNARAMPLPRAAVAPVSPQEPLQGSGALDLGAPGVSRGAAGTGEKTPMVLVPPRASAERQGFSNDPSPQEFGTSGQPFTTNRVNAMSDTTTSFYPFRAAGKLFFKEGASTYVCSASLIKPGVIVTAAHCVAAFGARQFYTGWEFYPAYNNGLAPYGKSTAKTATVLTAYYDGTDSCAQRGVICRDDVAVITLNPSGGSYVGRRTGYFGYGWNGYGFNGAKQALINQLGYPVALDRGGLMQRTDSQGVVNAAYSANTIIGSLQTGGSSGGPWLVNLGVAPALSGTGFGSASARNTVVGATSWGYTSTTVKQQGASAFTSGNIVVLVGAACNGTPAAC